MPRHFGWDVISRAARFVETRLARAAARGAERLLPALRLPVARDAQGARRILRQIRAENRLFVHCATWPAAGLFLVTLNLATEPEAPWSWIAMTAWGLVIAGGYRRLRKQRERLLDGRRGPAAAGAADKDLPAAGDGEEASGAEIAGLRDKLLRAAAAARDVLRSSRPDVLPEITRGETRALAVLAWLEEAEPPAHRFRIDHALRRETATRLAAARDRAEREPLEKLLGELDVHEQQLSVLQRLISGRRSRVESFLLALESTKAAGAAGGDPGTVSASLRERIALLTSSAEPAAGAAKAAPEVSEPAARFREEVRLARDLQRSILPAAAPRIPGLRVAHLYRPSNEVGGDFYDFYDAGEDRLLVAIGDASGHGLDSSMVSSMAKSAVYMQLGGRRRGSAEPLPAALSEINRMMCDTLGRRRLMTLALIELDAGAGTLSWVNAGQIYPLLCRAGRVRELEQPGYPLGIRRDLDYPIRVESLEPGDRLLLLTDGYVEAQSPEGEPLGWDRLVASLARSRSYDVEAFLEDLDRDLDDYLRAPQPQDDVTLIAIDFLP